MSSGELAEAHICPTDLPRHGKSNPHHWAAANQPDGQITSDFQKSCQAPKSKIFRLAVGQISARDFGRPVPTRGALRDRHGRWVRDAVDAAAVRASDSEPDDE